MSDDSHREPPISASALTDNHPVADAANTHRPLSKPLAAYILGYNSRILRLWQFLFWLWSGEGDTEQGVPNALD